MKCKNCGAEIPENQDICSACGAQAGNGPEGGQADTAAGTAELKSGNSVAGDSANAAADTTGAAGDSASESANATGVAGDSADASANETDASEGAGNESGAAGMEPDAPKKSVVSLAKPSESGEAAPSQGTLDTLSQGTPDTPAPGTSDTPASGAPASGAAGNTEPKKKSNKAIIGAAAAVAVVAVGAFGMAKMNEKDPKQVVIDAFENVYKDGQVYPVEELLGIPEFMEQAGKMNAEGGMTLKLDRCSYEAANAYAGSGFRIVGKNDYTNKKTSAELAAIYNGMDLVRMEVYYGGDMLKASLPELSGKVFTIDLSEGLAERAAQSPVLGPIMQQNNIDIEGIASYYTEIIDEVQKNQAEGKDPYGVVNLWNRYKEGCKAQENFKAALSVEKADKAAFTIDGKEEKCKGYDVLVSKASMLDFLRTSSDFFLQDEKLKEQYLKQLEMTVKMSELMGGSANGMSMPSAEEMQQQSYEEIQRTVNEALDFLDGSLDDVAMKVYVDKQGRLAAVEGNTNMHDPDNAEDTINVAFRAELSGGAYLTQNASGNITLSDPDDGEKSIALDFIKQGTYDGKMLTCDWSADLSMMPEDEKYSLTYTGTYNSDGGDYHVSLEAGEKVSQVMKISVTGAVDKLEKGTAFHTNIDELEFAFMDGMYSAVLSGEYDYKPLSGEITAPEGEEMDVLAADEEDWQNVMMEMIYGVMGLAEQMGISLY